MNSLDYSKVVSLLAKNAREKMQGWCAVCNREVREGLTEKETLEQRLEGLRERAMLGSEGRDRGMGKCKGPEARMS